MVPLREPCTMNIFSYLEDFFSIILKVYFPRYKLNNFNKVYF